VSAATTSPIRRRLLPEGLKPRNISVSPSGLTVHAEVGAASAHCPLCGNRSPKVHSRYIRTIADLPWRNVSLTLKIRVRRFFCLNRRCERAIFCERLPEVAPYARKTDRLEEALLSIALELGGEAGARLARQLGLLLVSPDALLERIRGAPACGVDEGVRALGIDDWAKKKGHSYGTILVDLEKHRVVDLLPDRTAQTLEEWLKAHPGIEVVSRDRYQPYIDAIKRGAPKAVQVADRFHLMKNLTDTLERLLERERISLQEALKLTLPEEPPYLPPLMVAYIKFCWKHGDGNVGEGIWEKLCQTPSLRSYRKAFEYVVKRLEEGLPTQRTREETLKAKAEAKRRAPRALARLFGRDPEKLSAADREYLRELWGLNPELERAYELAQGFSRMLRERDPEMLDRWLEEASESDSPELLRSFAEGLRADQDAVRAALCECWSNGQVEGQINRLKLLKRQMYGRANLDLLKRRAVGAA
jgi:transposase